MVDHFIKVVVKTNASREEILYSNKTLHVKLKEKPLHNKANEELVKLVKKTFECPVILIKGFKSKQKLIKVEGISASEFDKKIAQLNHA